MFRNEEFVQRRVFLPRFGAAQQIILRYEPQNPPSDPQTHQLVIAALSLWPLLLSSFESRVLTEND